MKRFLLATVLSAPLFAAPVDWGEQEEFPSPPSFFPFSVGGSYANILPATFYYPDGFNEQKLQYLQYDANFSYTQPFSQINGMIFGVGWVGVDLDWSENPSFSQTRFDYVSFSVGGFSKVFTNWMWTLNQAAFLDPQKFSFSSYALYQTVLWGKYTWRPWLELDAGFLLELGLNRDYVWPILGFIYHYNKKLHLHAVYPIDMTLEYDILPKLTAAGSIRIFRNRHRVGFDEPLSEGLFLYQSWGVEFELEYRAAPWFFINGFAGSATHGRLSISDNSNQNITIYKINSSFYAGLNSALSF